MPRHNAAAISTKAALRTDDAELDERPASTSHAILSRLLGSVDFYYNAYRWTVQPRAERWYTRGYGDLTGYFEAADRWMAKWAQTGLSELDTPVVISWESWTGPPGVLRDEGSFVSPCHETLPEDVRTVRFLFVRAASSPVGESLLPPTRSIIVHTAATGTSRVSNDGLGLARRRLSSLLSCWLASTRACQALPLTRSARPSSPCRSCSTASPP